MGDFNVKLSKTHEELKDFTRNLLKDVQALEYMLDHGWFETGVSMIGAEQEFCLTDRNAKPYSQNTKILEKAKMDNLSPELARFNLEINASPQKFSGKALSKMEKEIITNLEKVRKVAEQFDSDIILTGILPTLRKFDIERDKITPIDRYYALMDALREMRGEEFIINIHGIDELNMRLSSGLIEAANTGFQVHLQVDPDSFAKFYNIAQVIAGPVLAASVNAPLLFGKRLWKETRIALFQQAIDTRVSEEHIRDRHPRVTFGNDWVKDSVIDIFKEDIIRYRVLLGADIEEDSLKAIKESRTPVMKALTVHNSTIYRWNRPVYGISSNGKPHLRIEARMFPAGPSVVDEMANAALWLGLMVGYADKYEDITRHISFAQAKENFYGAARGGMSKRFTWLDGEVIYADKLILNKLIPVAEEGLKKMKIDDADIKKYMDNIRHRVKKSVTGADWMIQVFNKFENKASKEEILSLITCHSIENQKKDIPIHRWKIPEIKDLPHWHPSRLLVEEVMKTDVLSVHPHDIVEFVADMLNWAKVRYIPVENDQGEFVGLITSRIIMRTLRKFNHKKLKNLQVHELMIEKPYIVQPDQKLKEAMQIMEENKIGCLPVVHRKKLVGLLTETEFFQLSKRLFERF